MSIEGTIVGLAFFAALGLLAKPVIGAVRRSLSNYSSKIIEEVSSVEEELFRTEGLLVTAMKRNSCLNDEVEKIIADARVRATKIYEDAKCKAEEDLLVALNKVRTRIERDNRDLVMKVKLSVLDGVFKCLAGFGGKSLEKTEHEVLILHMVERLSADLSACNEQ